MEGQFRVNRVTLAVGWPLPVYPIKRHRQTAPACRVGAKNGGGFCFIRLTYRYGQVVSEESTGMVDTAGLGLPHFQSLTRRTISG